MTEYVEFKIGKRTSINRLCICITEPGERGMIESGFLHSYRRVRKLQRYMNVHTMKGHAS